MSDFAIFLKRYWAPVSILGLFALGVVLPVFVSEFETRCFEDRWKYGLVIETEGTIEEIYRQTGVVFPSSGALLRSPYTPLGGMNDLPQTIRLQAALSANGRLVYTSQIPHKVSDTPGHNHPTAMSTFDQDGETTYSAVQRTAKRLEFCVWPADQRRRFEKALIADFHVPYSRIRGDERTLPPTPEPPTRRDDLKAYLAFLKRRMNGEMVDGWGAALQFRIVNGRLEARSAGPDRQFFTHDDLARRAAAL